VISPHPFPYLVPFLVFNGSWSERLFYHMFRSLLALPLVDVLYEVVSCDCTPLLLPATPPARAHTRFNPPAARLASIAPGVAPL